MLTLNGHIDAVHSVSLSGDGEFIVSGSMDGQIRLWDIATGECLVATGGPWSRIDSVRFHSTNPPLVQLEVCGEILYWAPSFPSHMSSPSDIETGISTYPHERPALYYINERWIKVDWGEKHGSTPIWRIPPTIELRRSSLHGNTMVIGGADGEILIL